MSELNWKAARGLAQLLICLAILLFVPARSLDYWQAWAFLTLFSASVMAITLYLAKYDPKLLERRTKAGPGAERRFRQNIIQALAALSFAAVLIIPANDHRYGWSAMPWWMSLAGDAVVALGLFIVFLVFKENSFTSAIIEVDSEQKVVSTGPYAIVRHPMYAGALVMIIGMPLALGSWWGLLTVIPIALVIVWRLIDEEEFLARNLAGYAEYRIQVKYRLIPHLW
jgi:protein-S-isoprenylcysteine O-methyltransferase Ste14